MHTKMWRFVLKCLFMNQKIKKTPALETKKNVKRSLLTCQAKG